MGGTGVVGGVGGGGEQEESSINNRINSFSLYAGPQARMRLRMQVFHGISGHNVPTIQ